MTLWLRNNKIVLFIVIFALAAVFACAGINSLLPFKADTALYLIYADSLIKGMGCIYTAGLKDAPANYHPCAYPVMLSVLSSVFPQQYSVFKFFNVIFMLLGIGVFFYLIRERLDKDIIYLLALPLVALNPQIIYYSRQILSEAPYLFFFMLSLFFLTRFQQSKSPVNIYLFLSIIAIQISLNIRLIGISLYAVASAFFFLKREFKKSAVFLSVFLFIITDWLLKNSGLEARSIYAQEFLMRTSGVFSFVYRWVYNLAATVGKELPDLFFYPFLAAIEPYSKAFVIKFIVGCGIFLLLLKGAVLKCRKDGLDLFDIYVIVYVFLFYLSWTHHGARYLVPVLPFLVLYFISGLKAFIRQKKLFYCAIALLTALYFIGNIKEAIDEQKHPYSPAEQSFISAVDWIKANAPKDSLILSRQPDWIYIYTDGYRGSKFLRTADIERQYIYVRDNKIDYIIIDHNKIYRDKATDYLFPLVSKYKESFERVHVTSLYPQTHIYKVIRQR